MADNFKVGLPIEKIIEMLDGGIIEGSISGERVDEYTVNIQGGRKVVVLVYEKHYMRVWNRLTLTVTLDDMEGGYTNVHTVGGGGGESMVVKFDWGAGESFEGVPRKILKAYI